VASFAGVVLLASPPARVLPEDPARPRAAGIAILPAVLLATGESWAAWAVGGLENTFAACLTLAAFLAYFRHLRRRGRAALVASSLLSAAAALTHPSYALFGIVLGAHLLLRCRQRSATVADLAWFAAPIAVAGAPYLAWKLAYYGHVLPNTFHAKFGVTGAVLRRGLRYYGAAAVAFPLHALAVFALPALLAWRRPRDPRPWILVAAVYAYCGYGIAIGGEDFAGFRLLVVALPLACLLVPYALTLAPGSGRLGRSPALAGAAVVVLALGSGAASWASPKVRVLDEAVGNDAVHLFRAAALELKRHFPEDTLLAHSGAGVMAYYTDFPFLDTLGLTDAHIASRRVETLGLGGAGHEKGDGAYVFARRPGVVMISGSPVSSLVPGLLGDLELLAIPEFHREYSPFMIVFPFKPSWGPERRIEMPIFVRNDVEIR
jgi:arabinofuranosyltransferase